MREKLKTIISLLCKEYFLKRLSSVICNDDDLIVKYRNREDVTINIWGWYPRNLVISTINDSLHDYDVIAINRHWLMTDIQLSVRKI